MVLRCEAKYAPGSMADTSIVATALSAPMVLSLSSTIFYTIYLYTRYYGLLKNEAIRDYNVL
jgi:hypothetical protein